LLSHDIRNTVFGSKSLLVSAKLLKTLGVQYSLWAHSVLNTNILMIHKDESLAK